MSKNNQGVKMAKQSSAGNSPTDAELNPNVDLTLDDAGVGNRPCLLWPQFFFQG